MVALTTLAGFCQRFAGNATPLPALRAPGMDTRVGELMSDGHPVGSLRFERQYRGR